MNDSYCDGWKGWDCSWHGHLLPTWSPAPSPFLPRFLYDISLICEIFQFINTDTVSHFEKYGLGHCFPGETQVRRPNKACGPQYATRALDSFNYLTLVWTCHILFWHLLRDNNDDNASSCLPWLIFHFSILYKH